MQEFGAFVAKNKLSALLDEVEKGAEITITRHGRPVARLVAPASFDRAAGLVAAERIVTRSKGVILGGGSIKDLIGEGRR